jgi:hypothetical protein
MEEAWGVIQTAVTIVIIAMVLWTFVKPTWRHGIASLLSSFWQVVRPMAYKIVTGMPAPEDDTELETTDIHRRVMSSVRSHNLATNELQDRSVAAPLPVKGNGETGETPIATVKREEANNFTFPDVFDALAVLVLDKTLTETEALKKGCKVNPGKSERYKVARQRLQEAMTKLAPEKYTPLDEDCKPILK